MNSIDSTFFIIVVFATRQRFKKFKLITFVSISYFEQFSSCFVKDISKEFHEIKVKIQIYLELEAVYFE